jgi:oligosaccharide repeat unit polymerase
MRALAPTTLVFACVAATLIFAGWTLSHLERFNLVALFMQRESLDVAVFTGIGFAWIVLSLLVLLAGDYVAQACLPAPPIFRPMVNLERAALVAFLANALLILVTLCWIAVSAQKVGGLVNLASMAYLDSLGARDLLLENKLFTGMRLFYAALPATGCFAAGILAAGHDQLSRQARMFCIITLLLNAVALFLLPLVMSQRLLLLQFLLSSFLITCLVQRRLVGVTWIGFGAIIFLASWVLRESATNPLIEGSGLNIGFQKLAFYFVNDLWNGFAPLQADIPHTFGAISLKGLMFLTFTQSTFSPLLETRLTNLDMVLGGGDFPFFTAAFVDFGAIGGAVFIASCAAIFRLLFHMSHHNLLWSCIYAQLGATLLFSTHGIYFTHQNFIFSIAVIVTINALSLMSGRYSLNQTYHHA